MAIVPLLLMSTNVMMAISRSGTSTPPTESPNTLDGSGHGAVVDMRTVM